ncbi:hypothetical protein [Luteolibacter sp. LG18]|uniref:hypothetical protein n=1 Tax=Luteolibacter sp. LG18 TaxID=2819286 RepID=UPI002B2F159D|nr:hypothetical protein llg_05180 [Luteolibacter sp. LG18]
MKHQSILVAAVAALVLGTQAVRAEGEEKKEKDHGKGGAAGLLEKFDTNKDGELSKEEIAGIPEKRSKHLLEKYDTNKDGALSKDELAAIKEEKHEKKEGDKKEEKPAEKK